MSEIHIRRLKGWRFDYITDDYKSIGNITRECSYCQVVELNSVYCYIIDCLKEAGLLDKDYKEICCFCYVLERFGLLEVNNIIIGFDYSVLKDLLKIKVAFRTVENGSMSCHPLIFRIHDYSKWA